MKKESKRNPRGNLLDFLIFVYLAYNVLFLIGAIVVTLKGGIPMPIFPFFLLLFLGPILLIIYLFIEKKKTYSLRTEKARLEKSIKESEFEEREYRGKIEAYKDVLNNLPPKIEEIEKVIKKLDREKYECAVCGTVFFTEAPAEGLVCPKCRADFVSTVPEQKGRAFEFWCKYGFENEGKIFPTWPGGWLEKEAPISSEKEFIERYKNGTLPTKGRPDFVFYFAPRGGLGVTFQIECKWRKTNRHIKIRDLAKYGEYEKEGKIYLVIGLGNTPLNPDAVWLLPYNKLSLEEIEDGYINIEKLHKEGQKRLPYQVLWLNQREGVLKWRDRPMPENK